MKVPFPGPDCVRTFPWFALLVAAACGTNAPPDVVPVGPLSVTVGEELSVALEATDPDGDPVAFTVQGAPEGAAVAKNDAGWRFEYSPLASDASPGGRTYDLTFAATDGRGGRTAFPVPLVVYPEGTVPAFKGPFAWTLNLAETDHLAAVVRVRDDDSASLTLSLHEGIEGAVFEVIDGHTASLYWRPKPDQIAAGPVHTFRVGASDGLHAEVIADFAIVLINAELFGGCPGTPPVAVTEPLGDRHDGGDYVLRIDAKDAESVLRTATCLWTAVDGADEKDMNAVDLAAAGEGVLTGAIGNLSAAAGTGRLVWYFCRVSDDDDATSDACDHATRLPKTGRYAFAVYGPGAEDSCLEDAVAGPAADASTAAFLPGSTAGGLRLCGGQADVFRQDLAAGQALAVAVRPMSSAGTVDVRIEGPDGGVVSTGAWGTSARAGVDGTYVVRVVPADEAPVTYELSALVLPEACASDSFEAGDAPGQAAPLSAGSAEAVLCPADVDRYRFHLDAGQAAVLTARFDAAVADLDLALYRDGTDVPVRVSAGTLGQESVQIEAGEASDWIAVVDASGLASAPYDLDLRIEGLAQLCQDDLFAPNAALADASSIPDATMSRMKLCPGKADYYRMGLNGGEELSIYVQVEPPRLAPPLAILQDDGTVLAEGEVAGEIGTVEAQPAGPGNYVIRVGPAEGDEAVEYTLAVGATPPAGECRTDRLEPNDSMDAPAALAPGFTTHLTLCGQDADWFALKMGAWQSLDALLVFGSTSAHFALYDGAGTEVVAGVPGSFGEDLFFLAKEKGTYYLKVDGGADGWYTIALDMP